MSLPHRPLARARLLCLLAISWTTGVHAQTPDPETSAAPESPSDMGSSADPSSASAPPDPSLGAEAPPEPPPDPAEDPAREASHPCLADPRGAACASSCDVDRTQLECENVCADQADIDFCWAVCPANTNLTCHPSYYPPPPAYCPEFYNHKPKFRVGLRGVSGAQIRDRGAFYLGGELFGGLRLTPGVSVMLTAHLATGVDNRPWPIVSTGGSIGLEMLAFDAFLADTALVIDPEFGIWLPNVCFEDPCPVALMGSLGVRQMTFRTATIPSREGFQALTFGLESALGYDPWIDEVLARVGLSFGLDLAF